MFEEQISLWIKSHTHTHTRPSRTTKTEEEKKHMKNILSSQVL
jgi:hypothetical protein